MYESMKFAHRNQVLTKKKIKNFYCAKTNYNVIIILSHYIESTRNDTCAVLEIDFVVDIPFRMIVSDIRQS